MNIFRGRYWAVFGIASVIFFHGPVIAHASVLDNVMGWAWADPIGWISLNDLNQNAGSGSYGVNVNLSSGQMNGFGWSPNAGWVCFGSSCGHPDCAGTVPTSIPVYAAMKAEMIPAPYTTAGSIRNVHGWAKICNQGTDGWLSLNCADTSPSSCGSYAYRVPFDMTTHYFEDASNGGSPQNGTSFAWNANTNGTGFGYVDFHLAYLVVPAENTVASCSDGLDTDIDGAIDCLDSGCSAVPACLPPPPDLTEDQCPLGTVDACCSDNTDNDGNGFQDCADAACQGTASMCTVDWLKTTFGNVYAQKGIASIAAPANQYNASYCLSVTDGSIVGFASQLGCVATSTSLTLPSAMSGYRSSLGSIDISGIEKGRYGAVQVIADGNALPENLDGKAYEYLGGGTLTIPEKVFQNGTGSTGRGNGLLLVKGADVEIVGDLSYAPMSFQSSLKNMSSLGMIVTKDAQTGAGGSIFIDPQVHTAVGAYFAESSIHTGTSNQPLSFAGLMAARLFSFERTGGTSSTAAETMTFDGRAVVNPPPGMQNIGKSLPHTKIVF